MDLTQSGRRPPTPDPGEGMTETRTRRVRTLADMGRTRHTQRGGSPARPELHVPAPQFPNKAPAGHRTSRPVPASDGQPDRTPPLPVRSPGAHLHPLLRRSSVAGRGEGSV